MKTPTQIAEAFSGHRFREADDSLAPDVRWVLVGGDTIDGRDRVIDNCEQTLAALADTDTEFLRFVSDGRACAAGSADKPRSATRW
jgi:limonene-1,2-epoxide hydrolase